MKKPFESKYIINGVPRDLTPAQILSAVSAGRVSAEPDSGAEPIVDETVDPDFSPLEFHSSLVDSYLEKIIAAQRSYPVAFSSCYAKFRTAAALIDVIWRRGHFNVGDLTVGASWTWNDARVGNMAALYGGVEALCDYLDSLSLPLESCSCVEGDALSLKVSATVASHEEDEDSFAVQPFKTENPYLGDGELPHVLVPDESSWIVYVPFETAEYRFGGSLLAQATGNQGGIAVDVSDADYFMDCYEVVRELIEDGVVMSGCTVSDGGLLAAVRKMTEGGTGAVVDVSDVMRSKDEHRLAAVLFSEVPGVVLQIADSDFDYLDAELLLQDVAFFPLGHPSPDSSAVRVRASRKTGLQKILESLVQNQGGEGED